MILVIALSVVVSVQLILFACGVSAGISLLISLSAGITTLIVLDGRRRS